MLGTEAPKGKVTISRKTLCGIVVLVIVVFAGVMIYLFGSSSTRNVKIVRFFYVVEDTYTSGGQTVLPFYVKIENSGSKNVSDLVLLVKVFCDHSELGTETQHIRTLRAGRLRTMSMVVTVNTSELLGKVVNFVATLYLDNTVVDEVASPPGFITIP